MDIVATKTHCDRRIFMNDESIEFFRRYHSTMRRITPNRKYFFSDIADRYYPSNAVSSYFNKIWDQAGLRKDTEVRPRAYDLRHYFACKNILKWSSNNENVMAKLPYLMTIMGHSNIESTYYYIHLIPDFFPKYNDLSLLSSELIPEVVEDEI
nr:tyrosine-type recombinase/integrase [uncultured Thomasclavelia sp.]